MSLLWLILLSTCITAFSQSFTIPSTWKNTTALDDFATRLNHSTFAINELVPLFKSTTGTIQDLTFIQTADALSAAVLHDQISGNDAYRTWVRGSFQNVTRTFPDFYPYSSDDPSQPLNGDAVAWALTAARAATAYSDDKGFFLSISATLWDWTNRSSISPNFISAVEDTSLCDPASLIGGIRENAVNTQKLFVNSTTIIGFAALSAYLYNITGNDVYHESLKNMAQYIKDHLFNATNLTFSSPCAPWNGTAPSDAGLLIEALSVANIPEISEVFGLNNFINSSIMSPLWTNSTTGIMSDNLTMTSNDPTSKGIFVRSLYEARIRMDNGTDVAQLINNFINIQYNSLINSAHNTRNNFYPRNWTGPPVKELDSPGQLAAANLLSASMALMALINGAPPSPSPTDDSSPSATLTPPSEAAGGSVIKLPVLVTLIVLSWVLGVANASFLWLRYRRRRTQRVPTRESPS